MPAAFGKNSMTPEEFRKLYMGEYRMSDKDPNYKLGCLETGVKVALMKMKEHRTDCAPLGQGIVDFCIRTLEECTGVKYEEPQS